MRSWYTTTDGDRVSLLQQGDDDLPERTAVLYSYEWPNTPQFIEYEGLVDALWVYAESLRQATTRGLLAEVGTNPKTEGE
ncbi:hypothetical protein OG381_34490 [Streptomyces sp. NBC_00490]|uniref:hypothetical protein n=1 Tax=Streptomyces sp. NBC_00490 TaxID=2903657 RepID=UPI002E187773